MDENKKGLSKDDISSSNEFDVDGFKAFIHGHEEWLMEKILHYAKRQGYSAYTSTLKEAWRLSVSGLTNSIMEGIRQHRTIPEMTPEENLSCDPVAMFGIIEAQRHRERGVSLGMFLGLMKYYRQSYIDLLMINESLLEDRAACELFLNRIFDRIEIGFCVEWSGSKGDKALQELRISNRLPGRWLRGPFSWCAWVKNRRGERYRLPAS